jgi:hypothetical protein
MKRIQKHVNIGETYVLGDNPLVLLTALQIPFEADPSSTYVSKMTSIIAEQGTYQFNHSGEPSAFIPGLMLTLCSMIFFAKLQLMNK